MVPAPFAWLTDSMYISPGEPFISRSITLITLSSSVCAEAPGYTAVTTMDGGATVGNREIGSCVVDTPPNTSMNSAITQAKTGRSMKNWAMNEPPYLPAAADAALGAAPAGALPPLPAPAAAGCHGTAFTLAPPRR